MSHSDAAAAVSGAAIATAEPARIIVRPCKQWDHPFAVSLGEPRGRVELPFGPCLRRAGGGGPGLPG